MGGLPPGGGVCIQGVDPPGCRPPHRILRDMVNERAVRILPECVLVSELIMAKVKLKDLQSYLQDVDVFDKPKVATRTVSNNTTHRM